MSPRYSDGIKVNAFAQDALNVAADGDVLRPLPCPKLIKEVGETIRTLYETPECCSTWDSCVSIGEFKRKDKPALYIWNDTDGGHIATGEEMCAGDTCKPGPGCPQAPPSVSTSGCTDPGYNAIATSYRYSYVSKHKIEGPLSDATPAVADNPDGTRIVTIPPPPAGYIDDYCIEEVCIYRATVRFKGGEEIPSTAGAAYQLVDCVPLTGTFVDSGLSTIPYPASTDGMEPMSEGAENFIMTEEGYGAWSEDTCVRITPQRKPTLVGDTRHAYWIDLKCEIRCLIEYNRDIYALTEGPVYRIQMQRSDGSMRVSPLRYPWPYPLCSKQSVVRGKAGIYYASTMGLVFLNSEGPRIISEPWFTKQDWSRECCEGMVAGMWCGELILRGKCDTWLIPINDGQVNLPENIGASRLDMRPDTFFQRKDGTTLYAEDGNVYELPDATEDCECCEMKWTSPIYSSFDYTQFEAMSINQRSGPCPTEVSVWAIDCNIRREIHTESIKENCKDWILPDCGDALQWYIEVKSCRWIDNLKLLPIRQDGVSLNAA